MNLNEPADERQSGSENSAPHFLRREAQYAMITGSLVFFAGALLVLAPLVLGRTMLNRFLVAFGIVGACLGTSMILHGGWDWIRSRR